MTQPLFERLTVIGLGLIGSSLARRAMQDGSIAREVVAYDASPTVRTRVAELGIVHRVADTGQEAVQDADCVVLCVPVGAMAPSAAAIIPYMRTGAILTDVGSTKQSVIREIQPFLRPDLHFVPAHPIAGTEYSGPDAGFSTLFEGRWTLITPIEGGDPEPVAKVAALWQLCGAMTREMDAAHHDRALAIVSHLPHLLAFTICGTADDLEGESRNEVLQFAASGFRDFTRIAASDPTMWRDVFLNNREALLEMLARFTEDAQAMARAIRWGDEEFIVDRIERGRRIRRSLIEIKQA
ncbi:prephenate/arogenate dehydrogenase family protein [Lichenicola cladoniae]|uniref:prephenate dehydrogenase n=1 Tax=Lichenicola cladoniae TaxID=1484109 RepID=A0A6M8HE47_9PROT|nr:prephenate/arogenate dehydrogenase family protein [Lichenicola cladoniae]NPD66745.1 prephenate/arogenate dehydrogenase family protein [Acetobacteraceae bacterium]QKE88690.1 prephenate/arogenate dehydrogenase family protein [Lichenicola cladoniae]